MEQEFFFPPPSLPSLHIARVLLDNKRDFLLDYAIPEALEKEIVLGTHVRVPFKNGFGKGIVVDILEKQNSALKPLLCRENKELLVPQNILKLCKWIADYYCSPLISALQAALPDSIRATIKPKEDLLLSLPAHLDPLSIQSKIKRAKKEKEALDFLQKWQPAWLSELPKKTGISRNIWKNLLRKGLIVGLSQKKDGNYFPIVPDLSFPKCLTKEQSHAVRLIEEEMHKGLPQPILLFGVTGSGKTEVYMRTIEKCLTQKKQVLLLVPEISLTPQLLERIKARFTAQGASIGCWHSRISRSEKATLWYDILRGKINILVGTRSALFAPFPSLGLIIVDEEHESSFKQEESPRYHGRDVAVMRARLEGALIILGSATPSLESYYNAMSGKYKLIELKRRVEERKLPSVSIVDLRKRKRNLSQQEKKGTDFYLKPEELISDELKEAIEKRLERKEQIILYINHRGYSSSLQCSDCGYVLPCPNCSISLSFHKNLGILNCHLCNYSASVPSFCPMCRAVGAFKFLGSGTEKVEEAIQQLFCSARVLRMDSDTMKKKGAVERALRAFGERQFDILVGTQMVSKGLDFPHVSLVGIVSIDGLLHLPDFRASEKSFQQLLQVSGRSGRGSVEGEVFVQTRTPYHPAIQFARHHDYLGFVDQELEFRKTLFYPPFCRAILIRFIGSPEEKVKFMTEAFTKEIKEALKDSNAIIGEPTQAPIAKIKGKYHYQLFIRCQKVMEISQKLKKLIFGKESEMGINIRIDVDPQDLLK
ncbi:primosomal protein N' [Candidatus Methylacidiphilum fumarolicum]|uniref:Replication restart protein PriA n=2 Tax=Candidatus Methylacidiphilum fumarolicum TaxID=591154 RepID=I0K1F4_METFB|nr:primosomal protein N' [Candidatus Methylacidiphilum fumarolicum]MBW6414919.1 primosomal protein N' [Candidatus Methylacidiphilum fumarolicum]TFE70386.1 primosomal protein N' [Candidatus Methylacidiphilum fumarolicum]TFE73932.1 primosomal protein N' [Candidatus Methylacidiphilum fumarolicum]TFE74439.1 primosomal protein N' [Candidatus Methylacidiphilum fumarolicum]TFE77899.1 primosomal protein N' [Candidatus Methylacidiphilum fumarolicum]